MSFENLTAVGLIFLFLAQAITFFFLGILVGYVI